MRHQSDNKQVLPCTIFVYNMHGVIVNHCHVGRKKYLSQTAEKDEMNLTTAKCFGTMKTC